MDASADFPRLTPENHRETSPATNSYNCIAWAADDQERLWEPRRYWRPETDPADGHGLGALERASQTLGYEDCGGDESLEPDVAGGLYGEVMQLLKRPAT